MASSPPFNSKFSACDARNGCTMDASDGVSVYRFCREFETGILATLSVVRAE
ncbi:MAG: hypothetical protein PSX36_05900 [bacterium]|nr:hypothetical protein [bacterium]